MALLVALSTVVTSSVRAVEEPAELLKNTFAAAKAALQVGDLGAAERQCDHAITLGLRQVANLSTSESRFDEAASELDEALKFANGDPEIRIDAAVVAFRSGDVNKARQLAQSVVAENPGNARAQNILSRIDLYRGYFAHARAALYCARATPPAPFSRWKLPPN